MMKKRLSAFILGTALALTLAACGNGGSGNTAPSQGVTPSAPAPSESQSTSTADPAPESTPTQTTDGKTLVVYFSVPETTKPDNMKPEEEYSTVVIDGAVLGNTQYIASLIQENTGGDIFRIEPTTPYPMDHAELEAVATEEARQEALPEISGTIENMDEYDTVFIGYPNWYGDMPRILYTFLGQYDLAGKTVIPFVTSGASGFSGTIDTIAKLQPDAEVVTDGLSVLRNAAEAAEEPVLAWLADLGYSK